MSHIISITPYESYHIESIFTVHDMMSHDLHLTNIVRKMISTVTGHDKSGVAIENVGHHNSVLIGRILIFLLSGNHKSILICDKP